ncbi:MAG TPA: RNA polymerase factor sigma-54 [Gemmatales bacterium]|nr:RNA polymerase factor sigma-54 [Gemmatales bacterium]
MRLDTTQALRLQQKLILAPRMIQSMEILQMPNLELQERLEQELENNPVLELKEKRGEEEPSRDETPEAADVPADPEFDDYADDAWEDGDSRPSRSRAELAEDSDRKQSAINNVPARTVSLQDHLLEQLSELDVPPEVEPAVRHLIANVKTSGYLPSLEEITEGGDRSFTVTELEAALPWLQQMDPAGVGARDLRECLLLQIGPETQHRELLRLLITQHWDDLQHNRLPQIQRRTGYDLATLTAALETLRHLNPRPGAQFEGGDNVHYVVPDLIVERTEDGDYTVRLTNDYIPEVRLSRRWVNRFKSRKGDATERDYMRKKIQAAQWIIDAIMQRRQTLEKVTRAIIERQRDFLDHGPEHIHPLKMQQIADQVGVHVTTVSRAVDEKWVQTPRGTFQLKRFFVGGTTTQEGEEVAYELIKQKMLDLVAAEDKANPLSDEELMAKLREAGYPVARRTVTKYRKLLRIPSSRQRRQWAVDSTPHSSAS